MTFVWKIYALRCEAMRTLTSSILGVVVCVLSSCGWLAGDKVALSRRKYASMVAIQRDAGKPGNKENKWVP